EGGAQRGDHARRNILPAPQLHAVLTEGVSRELFLGRAQLQQGALGTVSRRRGTVSGACIQDAAEQPSLLRGSVLAQGGVHEGDLLGQDRAHYLRRPADGSDELAQFLRAGANVLRQVVLHDQGERVAVL